jgi:hypothetical protein
MPDRTYTVNYDCSSALTAAAAVNALTMALESLETVAERVKPKLQGFASGVSTGFTNTVKASDRLKDSLNNVAVAGNTASASFRGLQNQTATLNTHIQGAHTYAGHATGSFGEWASKGLHLNATLMRVAYAAAGITTAVALYKGFTDTLHNAEEYAEELADKVLKLHDEIRELKAITGQGEQATAAEVRKLMVEGREPDEQKVIGFAKMWGSALPAAQQSGGWKLNDEQTEEVKTQALRFASSQGIAPEVMGRMVASIGIGQDVKTPDDVMGQLASMHAMAVEGVGTFTPLMKAYNKLRGKMIQPGGGGAFKDPAELMAGISATSVETGNEAQIATAMSQVWRDLSTAKTKTQQKTFAKYGLDKGGDFATRIEKIAPLLDDALAAGKDPLQALSDAGFKNAASNAMIGNLVRDRAILRGRVNASRKAIDASAIKKMNDQQDVDNPERLAAATAESGKLERGEQERLLKSSRKFAEEGLEANEGYTAKDTWGEYLGRAMASATGREEPRKQLQDWITARTILTKQPAVAQRHIGKFFKPSGATDAQGRPRMKERRYLPQGQELADILNDMSPEERAEHLKNMRDWAAPTAATRRPGAAAGGASGEAAIPGAVGPHASRAATSDGRLLSVNEIQAGLLRDIRDRLGPPSGGFGTGPLFTDGGDSGPRRA